MVRIKFEFLLLKKYVRTSTHWHMQYNLSKLVTLRPAKTIGQKKINPSLPKRLQT